MCDKTNLKTPIRVKSTLPSLSPFSIPATPFMEKLGTGTGVGVYLLQRSSSKGFYSSPWAVKKINRRFVHKDSEYERRLQYEAKILKSLDHPNVIGFRSYTKSANGSVCLVMESGETSLLHLIEKRSEESSGPFEAYNIRIVARALAAALSYLHEQKRILHGDLKSANVLVKGDFSEVKLCDFGVSMELNDELVSIENDYVGTQAWSAPEALTGESVSHKTDMFSYGLIIWEMMALAAPHLTCLDIDSFIEETASEEEIERIMEEKEEKFQMQIGTRPALPENLGKEYEDMVKIFEMCTEKNEEERPSAKQVLKMMEKDILVRECHS